MTSSTQLRDCLEALSEGLPVGAVSIDLEDRARHGSDRWPIALKRRQQGQKAPLPAAVIRPPTHEDVVRTVTLAQTFGVPVFPWGAGSSVVGQAVPEQGAISLDLGSLNAVLEIDEDNLLIHIQAGAVGSDIERLLNERGYTLNFSPQSLYCSTVGGWVSTRATGQFSSRWGGIEDAVAALTAVLPNGAVLRTHPVPRAATGPDVKQLLIGAEGTLGVVTEVVLRIHRLVDARFLQTVHFPSIDAGLDAIQRVMQLGLRPFLLRLYDPDEARFSLGESKSEDAVLMIGTEGVGAVAEAEFMTALETCVTAGGTPVGSDSCERWMDNRYDFSAIQSVLDRPGGVAETIEVAHTWTGIRNTYSRLKEELTPLASQVLAHFSHAYASGTSLYMILLGEATSAADAERRLVAIWRTAMEVSLETGAAISHHHGIGLARLPWLRDAAGSEVDVLRQIKKALDPGAVLSPGRLALSNEAT